jgi:hypothetical protein
MKFVNLLGPAYVNGQLRHPHEGALHLSNEEAKRLIDDNLAEDVTDDFPARKLSKAHRPSTSPPIPARPSPRRPERPPHFAQGDER